MITFEDLIIANLKDNGHGLIKLLMDIEALPEELKCVNCNSTMTVIFFKVVISGYIYLFYQIRKDGSRLKWECNAKVRIGHQKAKRCGYSKSITSGTLFHNTHLTIKQVSVFILLWVRKCSLSVSAFLYVIQRSFINKIQKNLDFQTYSLVTKFSHKKISFA